MRLKGAKKHKLANVRYGFVIDHNRCIGCHACTIACKDEHNVPVGVFRTWVKYIEKGEFPNTSRHFGVMRCNHCDAAPCVEICPTKSLFRRDDGIIDFDNSRCIGCKSCMQACPYDALHIDPNTHTAAKCNYCAHRIELQLEPACVVVCPTQAIIAGDLDDPQSRIGQIVATQEVAARKPHKGTQPKLFYAGIAPELLQPAMMEPQATHLFADHNPAANISLLETPRKELAAPGLSRVVYDVAHPQPWGMIPAFYLWTKSIAAGLLIAAAILMFATNLGNTAVIATVLSPIVAIVFLGATTILLIADLDRPDRFYFILTKSNPRSWLVWGTWVLIVYGILAVGWLACAILTSQVPRSLIVLAAFSGMAAAGYSAFLFAQGRGRDLWQSPIFLWHLIVQAVVAGAATMILIAAIPGLGQAADVRNEVILKLIPLLAGGIVISTLMILGEVLLPASSSDVERAITLITRGKLRIRFWYGTILMGALIPLALLALQLGGAVSGVGLDAMAAVLALAGLLFFEEIWITAGQAPPLS
jgi:Fe-S-cluster-containing dehydrogenase component/formate-dependent nitrite reductase membrane component NrfD